MTPLRARRRIFAYGALALLAVAISAGISLRPLLSGRSESRQVRSGDLALQKVFELRTTLADWQVFAEPFFARVTATGVKIDATELAKGATIAQAVAPQVKVIAAALTDSGFTPTARVLESGNTRFSNMLTNLSPLVEGTSTAVIAATTAAERAAYEQLWTGSEAAAAQLRQARDVDLHQTVAHLDNGRATVLAVDALAAVAAVCTTLAIGGRARRRERAERTRVERRTFETALQRALEMSKVEADAYQVVTRALDGSVPRLQVEMLVADSSRAHFHQALSAGTSGPDARGGCGVLSPLECPATTQGHSLLFPSSSALDACPYLQGRMTGTCSAACVPVSIAGKTVGVVHATAPDEQPPTQSEVQVLEFTARRAAERVGMLRAFAKSETQAASDPLTGLWNRRSLENRIHDLQRERVPYALAYGDLDHFKVLNDTFGHEAGDQALRLFSRVLRDSLRPDDIACRYGGEEFVIVLPDCETTTAIAVLERVRERLASALTAGRVPPFTVSFGVATSLDADTFDGVVAVADGALLRAKAAGRDRVVVGSTIVAGHPDTLPGSPLALVPATTPAPAVARPDLSGMVVEPHL